MKKIFFHFLSIALFASGLQSFLFSQEKLKIAIIPKGNTHVFWKAVRSGVKLGAVSLSGVEIIWKGPAVENDKSQQIAIVEQCIAEGVSGIALAPLDYDALAVPVAKAMKKRIPVLIFDSALKGAPGKEFISFVATDNRKSGYLAGEQLATLLNGKGKVVLLRYVAGQESTKEREEGFLEAIAKQQGIQVVQKNRYGGNTADEATKVSLDMVDKLKEADGVFCPNESTTMGMLLALRSVHLAGKIKFVGFDTSTPLIAALKNKEINSLIAQDPSRMGYYSVKTIVDYIRGKKTPFTIDTGVHLITSNNLNDPEIQNLLVLQSLSE